jgi:hypothetical protein
MAIQISAVTVVLRGDEHQRHDNHVEQHEQHHRSRPATCGSRFLVQVRNLDHAVPQCPLTLHLELVRSQFFDSLPPPRSSLVPREIQDGRYQRASDEQESCAYQMVCRPVAQCYSKHVHDPLVSTVLTDAKLVSARSTRSRRRLTQR